MEKTFFYQRKPYTTLSKNKSYFFYNFFQRLYLLKIKKYFFLIFRNFYLQKSIYLLKFVNKI
ncbi:hypothetical protein CGC58_08880 [Capnocytophaga stomatis]|uniref:Uncharacterized protein n=1 Tax=Capnocytophaga stomatis TaxID=1848904 RepID=A0A250FXF6_9FLAO|nr:hypothetical protein CGC58_08880 [Capnocytophaga stomatis]